MSVEKKPLFVGGFEMTLKNGKPRPFPKWNGKEHPDFGYNVNMLVKYMLKTEKAKREFMAWIQSAKLNEDVKNEIVAVYNIGWNNALFKVLEALG